MSTRAKLAVLEVLREPSRAPLDGLQRLNSASRARLLTWLDQSGLALYFLEALERSGISSDIDSRLRNELLQRRRGNGTRVASLLRDFATANEALTALGIPYAVLKGFSLVPEFCPAPELRHHTDIDILIPRSAANLATEEARKLGYLVESIEGSGEIRLATPTRHVPSARDSLYTVPWQRRLELHVDPWEPIGRVRLKAGPGWLDSRTWREFRNVRYPVLAPADAAVYQALHIFRHVLQSWIRLGWLYETALCLRRRAGDDPFWAVVVGRMGDDARVHHACSFVFALARKVFALELPGPIAEEVGRLPLPLGEWIERHIPGWELAEFPGDHRSLIVHREFVEQMRDWRSVQRSRARRLLSNITMEKLLSPAFLVRAVHKRAVYAWACLRWAGVLPKVGR